MALYTLNNGELQLKVADCGGVIEGLWWQHEGLALPLLRTGLQSGVAVESSCFPLVPFGNRVSGNRFSSAAGEYQLHPNVAWDDHYLHGDGWLNVWHGLAQSPTQLTLEYVHRQGVYHYTAQQHFTLTGNALMVELVVTNESEATLPFGLGWHPYFPLTPQTKLQADANGYWLEREQWLAGEFQSQIPPELDFNHPSPLPQRWVNNAFSGWDGRATIDQPELGYRLSLTTEPPAPCYFIFVSDPEFDRGYAFDFFCIEPMSHAPDDHHRSEFGQLTLLSTGESMRQQMTLQVYVP
ncbi:galactose mutarotase-like enzyme [Raoultella sp. BIGb0138]|uniref:aldose 1-epimerase n=1 Tax=Raoultella sp. BIGb0138 TaxID=2485115 RepID=UPI00104BEB76|nr:aldose 1-epimerase [Raoultella sp. BIGb0138]TCW18159.1 galactose mutarotase-like enzyme [Raoultella sp. BIGb0138]